MTKPPGPGGLPAGRAVGYCGVDPTPFTPGGPLARLIADPATRPTLQAWLRDAGTLIDAAEAHPDAEPLAGRGRVTAVPVSGGAERWVVRHYHRGGAVASLLGDRYLRVGTPRPFHELRTGRALESLGVPTVPHLAAAVYPSGPWYRGDLVTRWVPDSRDLAAVLFPGGTLDGAAASRGGPDGKGSGHAAPGDRDERLAGPDEEAVEAMTAAGELIRLLHDRGVAHPDLNLKNLLITGRGPDLRALVLDLDRARIQAQLGAGSRRRMLERFWRSATKWEDATGRTIPPELRAAFDAGYGG